MKRTGCMKNLSKPSSDDAAPCRKAAWPASPSHICKMRLGRMGITMLNASTSRKSTTQMRPVTELSPASPNIARVR